MPIGATSGTWNFNPALSEILVEAFDRCGIRGTALTRRHLRSARNSLNYELISWANRGVNLWEVMPATISLVPGQATYLVPATCVSMLDVYYTTVNGGGPGINQDRIMLPIGRTYYAAIPNKNQPGIPTVYWYQKLEQPQITLWSPPMLGAPTYVLNYFYLSRIQDANPVSGQTADVPFLALDALAAGLARRLAGKFAKDHVQELTAEAKEAWEMFADANREDVPINISPDLSGFWRS